MTLGGMYGVDGRALDGGTANFRLGVSPRAVSDEFAVLVLRGLDCHVITSLTRLPRHTPPAFPHRVTCPALPPVSTLQPSGSW